MEIEIARNYRGHHLFDWRRPRSVWFDATKAVFIDMGVENLMWLKSCDDRGL